MNLRFVDETTTKTNMELYILCIPIIISTFIICSYCNNINCIGHEECKQMTIDCENDTDCYVNCNGELSCFQSLINCPYGKYDCYIDCIGTESCRLTNIC